jgi:hypothetical protein
MENMQKFGEEALEKRPLGRLEDVRITLKSI